MSDPIVLPDKMPSSAVGDLAQTIETASAGLEPGSEIRIDASGVRSIGALAAEQLLRFSDHVTAEGGRISITASAEFEDDLRILGLQDLLLRKDPAL